VRRHQDEQLPFIRRGELRHRAVGAEVPGFVAADMGVLPLSAEHRLGERGLLAARALLVVDPAAVTGHRPARPRLAGEKRLPHPPVDADGGEVDRVHVAAHRCLRFLQDSPRGPWRTATSHPDRQDQQRQSMNHDTHLARTGTRLRTPEYELLSTNS
jgi:hypothetical protein